MCFCDMMWRWLTLTATHTHTHIVVVETRTTKSLMQVDISDFDTFFVIVIFDYLFRANTNKVNFKIR